MKPPLSQIRHSSNASGSLRIIVAAGLAAFLITAIPTFVSAQTSAAGSTANTQTNGKKPKPTPKPTATPKPVVDGESDWKNTGGTDWNTGANWTAVSGTAPPAPGDVAWFKTAFSSGQPNLSTSTSIAGFYFGDKAGGTSSSGYDITSSSAAIKFTLTGTASTTGGTETSNSTAAAIGADNTSGTNTIDAPIVLGGANNTSQTFIQTAGGTLVINGVISNTNNVKLNLPGAGTVQLNGVNTYTGGTAVNTGTLQIGNDSALGTGTLTLGASGVIQATGGTRTISNNVLLGGSATIGGSNDLTINGTFTNSGGNQTLTVSNSGTTTLGGSMFLSEASGSGRTLGITGSGSLVLNGTIADFNGAGTAGSLNFSSSYTGTATINGTNTYSGATNLTGGTFVIGNKSAFGTSALRLNGVSISANTDLSGINAIANTVTIGGNNTFTGSNNIEFSGAWTDNASRVVTNNMSGGTLTLSGGVNLSNGSSNFTLTIAGTGSTLVNSAIANGGTSTASGLIKSGTGTLTLSGANTYGGTTTINGGTLNANAGGGNKALGGTTNIQVNNTGTILLTTTADQINHAATMTLNGGTFNTNGTNQTLGALTLSNNSFINLASGASVLSFGDSHLVSWTSAKTLEIDGWSGSQSGSGADQLIFGTTSGGLNAGQLAEVIFHDPAGFSAGNYAAMILANGEIVPIPETATWFGATLALCALAYSQRRRFARK